MATYNGANFIKEQIESILRQIGDEDEIVISDDSSTDNTIEIIESLNDQRIRIIRNQKFHSPIYNFENAIKQSQGDYIFLADQDDVWKETKVSTLLPLLDKYDMVFSNVHIVDSNLKIIRKKFWNSNPLHGIIRNIIKNPYLGCSMAFNRKALSYLLPFPDGLPMHDIWIGLCCELFSSVYFVDDELMYYRRHENNASSAGEKSTYPYIDRIKYRLRVVRMLMERKHMI